MEDKQLENEYLWIWWTHDHQWDFHRDKNNKPKYMTEDEARKAYDSLFKVEDTKRVRGFHL